MLRIPILELKSEELNKFSYYCRFNKLTQKSVTGKAMHSEEIDFAAQNLEISTLLFYQSVLCFSLLGGEDWGVG